MMRTQVDHGLSSNGRKKIEQDKDPAETGSKNGNTHDAHPQNIPELH
jgi:hypothetical protein